MYGTRDLQKHCRNCIVQVHVLVRAKCDNYLSILMIVSLRAKESLTAKLDVVLQDL